MPCDFVYFCFLLNRGPETLGAAFVTQIALSPDQMQGTVALRNISAGSSGLYQCTASNAIGKSTCLLNLQVVARKCAS